MSSTNKDAIDLHVPVDLLGLPVATQQTAQDSHAAHPGHLLRHTSVGSTLSLTWGGQKSVKTGKPSSISCISSLMCTTLIQIGDL